MPTDRSLQLTLEVLNAAGFAQRAFRRPRVLTGRVAQPVLVSLAGKPVLILPRNGLAYFTHHLTDNADSAFCSVIAHELGHLTSWDDMLFLPWFTYCICGLAGCATGIILAFLGRASLSVMLAHTIVMCALYWLGFYVIRRREAYSDAYAVMVLGNITPTKLALHALMADGRKLSSWGSSHFNVAERMTLLNRHGRPFLEMGFVDLGITSFFFLDALFHQTSGLAVPRNLVTALLRLLGDTANLFLLFLLLLMIAGLAAVNEGKPPRLRDLILASAFCMAVTGLHDFLKSGAISLYSAFIHGTTAILDLIIWAICFVILFRVLHRWAVAILGSRTGNVSERLFWNAALAATSFSILSSLANIAVDSAASSMMKRAAAEPTVSLDTGLQQMVARLLPAVLIWIVALLARLIFIAVLYVSAIMRTRHTTRATCSACCSSEDPTSTRSPLLLSCSRCNSILRPDLVVCIQESEAPSS